MGLPLISGSPPRRRESEPYPGGRLPTLRLELRTREKFLLPPGTSCLPTDSQMLDVWFSLLRHSLRHFPEGNLVYMYNCDIFFSLGAHLFELAPLFETSGGVGTIRPSGSRCGRFGRDRCSVSRVASRLNFIGLGRLVENPRVSTTSPGIGVFHPPIPVYARKILIQTGFICSFVEGTRTFAFFCTEHHATILPTSCGPAP